MDKVSIIVPVYNAQAYLEDCITSLLNQTYKNIEIILINDGSTDDSLNICKNWANKDERIKLVSKENGGVSSARNAGLDNVTGRYLSFVDPDDYVSSNYIETLYKDLTSNDAQISIIGHETVNGQARYIDKCDFSQNISILSPKEAILMMSSYKYFGVALWDKMFDIKLWKDVRFPDVKIGEDWFVIYDIFDSARKIVYNTAVCYFYRKTTNSLSKNKKISLDCVLASKHALDLVSEKYPDIKNKCYTIYVNENLSVYNKILMSGKKDSENKKVVLENAINSRKYIDYSILSAKKKIQFFLFYNLRAIYNLLLKVFVLIAR